MPCCVHGIDQLSNLGEFYRICSSKSILFESSADDLLDESLFMVYEHSGKDNVFMADSGISSKQLDWFRRSPDRNKARALAKISDYMNLHLEELMRRFLSAPPEKVKALCKEILEGAKLPAVQQPKTVGENTLFLAAINDGLMEAVETLAMDYLARAGGNGLVPHG